MKYNYKKVNRDIVLILLAIEMFVSLSAEPNPFTQYMGWFIAFLCWVLFLLSEKKMNDLVSNVNQFTKISPEQMNTQMEKYRETIGVKRND